MEKSEKCIECRMSRHRMIFFINISSQISGSNFLNIEKCKYFLDSSLLSSTDSTDLTDFNFLLDSSGHRNIGS